MRAGGLRAELTACVPLGYVCYSAGRRLGGRAGPALRARPRLLALCLAHALLVAPALAAALLAALTDGVDYRIVKG